MCRALQSAVVRAMQSSERVGRLWSTTAAREHFWQRVIRTFDARLRQYALRTRCSQGEADEIIWDTWQRAVACEQALVAARDKWQVLHPLIKRRCAERLRVWRRETDRLDDGPDPRTEDERARLDPREAGGWLSRAVLELSERQRLAVEYRCRWGWPYWAVAAAIDCSEPTARVHVHRGLEKLRAFALVEGPTHVNNMARNSS